MFCAKVLKSFCVYARYASGRLFDFLTTFEQKFSPSSSRDSSPPLGLVKVSSSFFSVVKVKLKFFFLCLYVLNRNGLKFFMGKLHHVTFFYIF